MASREDQAPQKIGALETSVQLVSLILLAIAPWYYAGADWSFQYYLFPIGCLLAFLMLGRVATAAYRGDSNFSPPSVAWLLLLLALVAQFQSIRWFDWKNENSLFPSVQIQRWALGLAPGLTARILPQSEFANTDPTRSIEATCDLRGIEAVHQQLALSVEPLTTTGASSSLLLAALLVWCGHAVWGHRKRCPWLLMAMTALGTLVGIYGVVGAFTKGRPNLLGLTYGPSFSEIGRAHV